MSLQERVSAAAERNAKRSKVSVSVVCQNTLSQKSPHIPPHPQVCEVQIAYRVAGHSVFPLSATRSGIRFETCYNGTYYEQYYVILDLATEQGKVGCFRGRPPDDDLTPRPPFTLSRSFATHCRRSCRSAS